jgi:hypothetical protein
MGRACAVTNEKSEGLLEVIKLVKDRKAFQIWLMNAIA